MIAEDKYRILIETFYLNYDQEIKRSIIEGKKIPYE